MAVIDYIRKFEWEDIKYSRSRPLVEISGLIAEKMRLIDGDIKKVMDLLNDAKNNLNTVAKGKDSTSYLVKDLGEIIYNS